MALRIVGPPTRIETRVGELEPRTALSSIATLSVAAVIFLVWLIYAGPGSDSTGDGAWVGWITAALNALSAGFVIVGVNHARAGRLERHRRSMLAALAASAAFLVVYVIHHALHGQVIYPGAGAAKAIYLGVLAVHVVLATLSLPAVLTTAWSAASGRTGLHRRLARRVAPLWLVGSITGVVVTVMLNLA